MGRKKSHGRKGKGQSGVPREKKKKTSDPVEGPVVVKGKGGSSAPVHVCSAHVVYKSVYTSLIIFMWY